MRIRLTIAIACLFLAPSAKASVSWVVHGHGFGHGVGMSAYGAYGYAEHGKGYRFILGHYYTGTSLGTISGPRVVRVLLDISSGDVGFSGATSACGKALDPRRNYEAHRSRRLGEAAQLGRQAARRLRTQAARRRRWPDRDRRRGDLPGRPRGGPDRKRQRLPQRRQRARRSTST